MHDALIVGSGFAGLVAALELSRRGKKVALLCDGRTPGGHFSGLNVDGLEFDLGMVMLEQCSPDLPHEDLQDYRPERRNDWTRFGHIAGQWLREQMPLRRVPTPTSVIEGRDIPDPLIANRLDALAGSGLPGPAPLARANPHHASRKLDAGPYDTLTYAEAAELNNGAAVQRRFFEPYVRKLSGGSSRDFLARQHRAAWAPLYYPETVQAALAGLPHGLPEYPFWIPESGCTAELVRCLNAAFSSSPGAVLEPERILSLSFDNDTWTARTSNGQAWAAPEIVLALPPQRCSELLQLPSRHLEANVPVGLWLCSVAADRVRFESGCRMVVDETYAIHRITCPERLAGTDAPRLRIVAETHPDLLTQRHPASEPADGIRLELSSLLGLFSPEDLTIHRHIDARNALALPTPSNLAVCDELRAHLAEVAPRAHPTGILLGYGTASINDQIVQALRIARALS